MNKSRRSVRGFSAGRSARKARIKSRPASCAELEVLAIDLINQDNFSEAEAIYREIIAAGTSNHAVYGNLAAICGMQGRFDELIVLLKRVLELKPDYPDAHNSLGIALQKQGDLVAAIASYSKALELKPNYPAAHYNLGNALKGQDDLAAAIASYNKALELKPDYLEAHYNLGNALKEQGDLAAAIASYSKALEIKPSCPDAYNGLGSAFKEQGNLAAAIGSYNKAVELKPDHPDAHYNLGVVLQEQGDLEGAISSYNTALEIKPSFPDAHWNLGLAMLMSGDYKRGWRKYEWRAKREKTNSKPHAQPQCNLWDGSRLDPESQILFVSEQGLGDTLQFMRYVLALRRQGIQVSLCAQQKLHSLIRVSGIDPAPLTPEQANAVVEGRWIPLLSAPRHLGVSPDNPVITEPYIKTTEELVAKWQVILAGEIRPIIAINWQGNPEHEKTSSRGRSLPLEAFAPIARYANASLLSLQKGFGSEQLASCSFQERFVSCQKQVDETWDFVETAAIIANCDLVITSDTSVAHLAGGMGKTTWLLLKKVPEWRWGLKGETTFWYPSMRLFRQNERGNWDEVLRRVAEALQKEFLEACTMGCASGAQSELVKPALVPAVPGLAESRLAPIRLG